MTSFFSYLTSAGVLLLVLLVLGAIAAKLYTRSSQERAFVRTGLGGLKVVLSGGAMVLPVFHEVVWVNRNTLRLPVNRADEQSLITRDRLRVDVSAEFYVRVAETAEAVATAAQTLGDRTMAPDTLRALVEGKFVDALRAAAAAMSMEELHEKRGDFVQHVKAAVSKDLSENGLELESVSLTGLNQTRLEFFDKNNAFDAEGLLKLTREIEVRRKTRNDIEQDTAVQIEQKNLAATTEQLSLKRQREEAVLRTDQSIAEATAEQKANIAKSEAEARRISEEAVLVANKNIEERRIETSTSVTLRAQEQNITVANKSREEAAAAAQAAEARALAVKAEEGIKTVQEVEIANRNKAVTLVRAEEKAREDSIAITVAAEAENSAAENLAAAARTRATGERDAQVLRASGIIAEGEAVAKALREKNEAQNLLSPELISQQVKLELLKALPAIIEQSVKPLERIDSIRIAEVGGLNTGGMAANANGAAGTGTPSGGLGNEVVTAALRYRTGQPVVDALMAEVGLRNGGDMAQLMSSAAAAAGVSIAAAPDAAPAEGAADK